MALSRQRASEKLPQSTPITGTVLNRDQLRRQLSETVKPASNSPDKDAYAVPTKVKLPKSKGESQASSRQVRFQDGPASNEEQRVRISRSFVERTTSSLSANQNGPLTRQVSSPVRRESGGDGGTMETHVSLCEDENGKVKGVVELSTARQKRVPHIKVRVICLIDVSGSMLHKGDKQQRRSKISILKKMAVDIIDALEDEEDFFGVMTFGEETKVLCPLTRVTSASRAHVKSTVSELDKSSGFSAVTDLSSALVDAVQMLTSAQQEEGLLYRNCIIVFSDGEVNAGETDPKDLVHLTREKIRECRLPRDMLADLWVNISCVTTGSNFSQPLYLLSKMCGSDAYFYVDGSKNFPEADMLIPLMLRKMACAQMVSVSIRASNGALLETQKCSQEYSVRRRRGREVSRDTMAYFIHDLPSGIQKTFQISLDLEQFSSSLDQDFLSVDVQYVDPLGVLYTVNKSVRRQEVVSVASNKTKALEIMAKTAMHQLRQGLQNTCRQVATALEDFPDEDVKASVSVAVQTGKKEADTLAAEILSQLEAGDLKNEFEKFVKAVKANLSKLQSLVESSSTRNGQCWQYTKAVSSAIGRELPSVTNVVAQSAVVCPLPKQRCESRRTQALSLYVLGEDERDGTLLHDAAKNVAKCLADVLNAAESAV